MGKVISFSNQKGGVGKTTSAVNIAAALTKKKKKVLLIDLDSQGNATSGVGISRRNVKNSSFDLITGNVEPLEAVIAAPFENLFLIPSSIDLAGAEIALSEYENRNLQLKNKFEVLKAEYDYVIVDCPPSLGTLTVNALAASDGVVIPMTCEYFSMEGLSQLIESIRLVKQRHNPTIDVEGILFTMYDSRLNLTAQVVNEVKKYFPNKLFNTVIPRNVRISEAPSFGKPVIYYDKSSKGAEAYEAFTAEFLKRRKAAEKQNKAK